VAVLTRKVVPIVASLALIGGLGATGATAAKSHKTTARIGGVCKKRGQKVKTKSGKTLKCTRVGKKLVWR
jgi:hypothetical protein